MVYKNYERTKNKIKDTFIQLVLEKKNLDLITTKDIIERAEIAKSTFYYHYDDVDGFLKEFYALIIEKFNKLVSGYYQKEGNSRFVYIRQIAENLKKYDDFFRILLKSEKSNSFISMFKKNLVEIFNNDANLKLHQITTDKRRAEIYMVANGISYLFVDYYRENLNVTLDEIAELVCLSVSKSGFESINQK